MKTIYISASNPELLFQYIRLTCYPENIGEQHHVIPKSFVPNNITITLSRSTHLEVHRLLAFSDIDGLFGEKMKMAYELMSRTNSFKGRKLSKEHRKKLSEAAKKRKRRKHSTETIEKIKKVHIGSKRREETKQRIRQANSPEIGKWVNEEKLECFYGTALELAQYIGSWDTCTRRVLKGTRKSHRGWKIV